MVEESSCYPTCPMCGVDYDAAITKRHDHEVTCPLCGENFVVPGNPQAPQKEYKIPFWADQFRQHSGEMKGASSDKQNQLNRGENPATIPWSMLIVVSVFLFLVLLCAGFAATFPGLNKIW